MRRIRARAVGRMELWEGPGFVNPSGERTRALEADLDHSHLSEECVQLKGDEALLHSSW